jgi:hypothetical protein
MLLLLAGIAGCQSRPVESSVPPLLAPPSLSEKELVARFAWLEFRPFQDPKLFFRIRVPRDWQARPSEIDFQQLHRQEMEGPVTLAEVGPPGKGNVFIRVSYMRPPENADLAVSRPVQMFVDNFVADQVIAYEPRGSKPRWGMLERYEAQGKRRLDELIEIANPGLGPSMALLRGSRIGELVFIVAGTAPSLQFEAWRQDFAVAADSFIPVEPRDQKKKGPASP